MFLKTIISDELNQDRLNRDVENYVERYRIDVGDEMFLSPNLRVPAELVIKRINKRITSRTTVITHLRANNNHIQNRINEMNKEIEDRSNYESEKGPIHRMLMTTKNIDFVTTSKKLSDEYEAATIAQFPLYRQQDSLKQCLVENLKDFEEKNRKIEIAKRIIAETTREIDRIKEDNELIERENQLMKENMEGVIKAPTITDYAYIIKRDKALQSEIDVWTKRVAMAEVRII